MDASRNNGLYRSLQLGRFLAASMVLWYHVYLDSPHRDFFGTTFDFGYLGVDFFFVLSGFIILYIHWHDIGQTSRITNFIKKRFIRLYPTYFILLTCMAGFFIMFPSYGFAKFHQVGYIAYNYTLLPTDGDPILGVAWTLQHEVVFYALFAVFLGWPAIGATLLATWFTASLFIETPLPYPLDWVCDPRHVEFLFGMLGAYFIKTTRIPKPRAVMGLGICLLIGIAIICDTIIHAGGGTLAQRMPTYLPAGFASAIIIVGAVAAERSGMRLPSVCILLGDISYVLYLSQEFVLEAFHKFSLRFHVWDYVSPEVYGIVTFAVAIIGATCFHLCVEKPVVRILRDRLGRTKLVTALS